MKVTLHEWPGVNDWYECKRRALVTAGKLTFQAPHRQWREKILKARHSPIRRLRFSFILEDVPYWVACELRTHVHDMPYVADLGFFIRSSRNDRQGEFDRNAARQDHPVSMIIDINAEQLQILANKRLCMQATEEARTAVREMCRLAQEQCPEFAGTLVPMCLWQGGTCHEMHPCGKNKDYIREVTSLGDCSTESEP